MSGEYAFRHVLRALDRQRHDAMMPIWANWAAIGRLLDRGIVRMIGWIVYGDIPCCAVWRRDWAFDHPLVSGSGVAAC